MRRSTTSFRDSRRLTVKPPATAAPRPAKGFRKRGIPRPTISPRRRSLRSRPATSRGRCATAGIPCPETITGAGLHRGIDPQKGWSAPGVEQGIANLLSNGMPSADGPSAAPGHVKSRVTLTRVLAGLECGSPCRRPDRGQLGATARRSRRGPALRPTRSAPSDRCSGQFRPSRPAAVGQGRGRLGARLEQPESGCSRSP